MITLPDRCLAQPCERAPTIRGLCTRDYNRAHRSGVLDEIALPPRHSAPPLWVRFFRKVDPGRRTAECWDWRGTLSESGYGVMQSEGRAIRAHRVSYDIHFPGLTPDHVVRHRCDRPVCVNPHHLEIGSHQDNVNDTVSRGRIARGEKIHTAVLTDDLVMSLRRRYARGERICDLASEFNFPWMLVGNAVKGRTWKHLPVTGATDGR